MGFLKKAVKSGFNSIGYELTNQAMYKKYETERAGLKDAVERLFFLISHIDTSKDKEEVSGFFNFVSGEVLKSKAQLFQDLFVLYHLKNKKNGFFIEFGATDGVTLSNTFLLEKEYNWKGILAEPGRVWKNRLKENRNSTIDNRCVWSTSRQTLVFNETDIAELSTINQYSDSDFLSEQRKSSNTYEVETITLMDLLDLYNAPAMIDYLSIDTEGSEYEILKGFDFSKYQFEVITVEHNFTSMRHDLYNLLTQNGYKRVFESISLIDDWYIKESF
jgi:FkbM family methyltransferase